MQDLTDGAKGLTIDEDTDKTEKERMDIFYNKVFAILYIWILFIYCFELKIFSLMDDFKFFYMTVAYLEKLN